MEKKIPKYLRARIVGKLAEEAAKSRLLEKYKESGFIIIEIEEGDRHHRDRYLIPPPKGRIWFILSRECCQKINKFLKESPGTLRSFDKLERAEKAEVIFQIFETMSLFEDRKPNLEKIEKIVRRISTSITGSEITRIEELEKLEELTASQRKILEILRENSEKRSELCEKVNIKRETMDKHLLSLKEKGWIARTGDRKDPLCFITLNGKEILDHSSFQPKKLRHKRIYLRDIKQTGINTNLFKKATSIFGEVSHTNRRTYLKNCMLVAKLNLMKELTPIKRAYVKYNKVGENYIRSNLSDDKVTALMYKVKGMRGFIRPDFSVFKMDGTVDVYEVKAKTSRLSLKQEEFLNKLGSKPWIKTHLIHAEFDFPESIKIEISRINNLPQV